MLRLPKSDKPGFIEDTQVHFISGDIHYYAAFKCTVRLDEDKCAGGIINLKRRVELRLPPLRS
jgi:hypothetical protein